jgi:amino acid transporter
MLIVAAFLILNVVGQDFLTSLYYLNTAAPTKYPFPFAPYYNFFAGLLAHNPLIAGIIVFGLLAFMYPGTYINVAMPVRCLFAWSIDRLLPDAVSAVNERTHTPILAIVISFIVGTMGVAWASFSASFFTVLGLVLFYSFVPVLFAGITGVLFPYRHPDLYHSSGVSRYQIFGLPLVSVTGVLCIASMIYFAALIVIFPQTTGGFPLWEIAAATMGIFIAGAAFYYIARSVRRNQGIDIDLAYREIPPD